MARVLKCKLHYRGDRPYRAEARVLPRTNIPRDEWLDLELGDNLQTALREWFTELEQSDAVEARA